MLKFRTINEQAKDFQWRGQPVISVDTKKKELVGDFANSGREWRPAGEPEKVRLHDFADKQLGKVIPYGVYDLKRNEGWVSVGIDHDTAEFAVASIHRWWIQMGRQSYPDAKELLIIADSGGSNGSASRLWKRELYSAGRLHRTHDPRLPLSAGYQQVEQNRAADVLPHQRQLASPTFGEPSGDHLAHRQYDHESRLAG
jgi:hypothetical protein